MAARLNINEIARLAGVSRATVSRYLNDGYVSAEKRREIARVIAETGYVPSSQAQTLRTGRTRFVGVIIPKINSESVSRMVAGISEMLNKSGYGVLLANTDNDEEAEVRFLRSLDAARVDGIILIGTVLTPTHLEVLAEKKVPVVILGQHAQGIPSVWFDDYACMRDLADHVLSTASNPVYIGVNLQDIAAGHKRTRAFCDSARGHKLEPITYLGDFSAESGAELAPRILAEHPTCDAILCATDSIAAGVLNYLQQVGKEVPAHIQVAGIGDSELARIVNPHLTSAHYFYRTSGVHAATLLVHLLRGEDVDESICIRPELRLRASTN